MLQHRQQHIPTTATSHPNDPIPREPQDIPQYSISPSESYKTSPRSSGESLTWSDASDSDTPSTPRTDPQVEDVIEHIKDLPAAAVDFTGTSEEKTSRPRIRRVSTRLLTQNTPDLRQLLGEGQTGTQLIEKFCCGGGCCFAETLPPDPTSRYSIPVVVPDNDAFRSLNLKLGNLSLDTELTHVAPLPPVTVSLDPVPSSAPKHTTTVHKQPPKFVQPHPPYSVFPAPVYHARELTKPGAEKRTFHFDLDVTDYPDEGGVDFKVGGAIGICPPNSTELVDATFNSLGIPSFARDKPVLLRTTGGRWPTIWGDDQPRALTTTRRELLTWCADVQSSPPTKPLLRLLAQHATAPHEAKILLYLCSAQGQAAFCDLRTGPHVTLPQLLAAFPSAKPPLNELLGVLKQLMPRFYSLSNDPHISSAREGLAGRRLIEMAVTIHEEPDWTGGMRTGVGSGYLERVARQFIEAEQSGIVAHEGQGRPGPAQVLDLTVPMFRGLMANPLSREFVSDGPMMLVGAGVGMAPFRGFILNRLKNANCANKIWLVQGVRDSLLDEIYSGELGVHEKDIKKVVQSRKPGRGSGEAKYVQDEVRLQADVVWFVINALDGRIFVCGSSKGMGEGVEEALVDVAMEKGGLRREEAVEFWRKKREGGQYIAETW